MIPTLRLAVVASLLAAAAGCGGQSLQWRTANVLGCVPDLVVISDVVHSYAIRQWKASCGGHDYACTESRTGASVNGASSDDPVCTEVAGPAPVSAAPPPATGSNGGEPPRGAAGFTFGADAATLEKACTAAGLSWKAAPDDRFTCGGAPTDVGFPAATSGKLCGGKLCSITVDGSRDATWAQLAERFARLRGSLTAKYGSPAAQATERLDDCTDDVSACFDRGRIRTHAAWRWPSGEALDLVLGGGAPGARPELRVVYGKPADAPKADAL